MIARTMRRLTAAAVLLAVAASMPSLRANTDDDAKPHRFKNGVVDQNTSPVIFTTKARVIGATGRMQPAALLLRHWSTD